MQLSFVFLLKRTILIPVSMKQPIIVLLILTVFSFASCNQGAIDLPSYTNPAPQLPVTLSSVRPVNLTIDPQLFSDTVYWDANFIRNEEKVEHIDHTYRMVYFGEVSIWPGTHSLKILNQRMPTADEFCYWSQKTREIDLSKVDSLTLSVVIYTRFFEGAGVKITVDWGNSNESLLIGEEHLTTTPSTGLPTINPKLTIPVSAEMASDVNQFTVKLGVLPGSKAEIFFDEIFLTAYTRQ
jgi:hypothetical protein